MRTAPTRYKPHHMLVFAIGADFVAQLMIEGRREFVAPHDFTWLPECS